VVHEAAVTAPASLKLPMLIFGIVEVRRLYRELEALEEYMRQSELRDAGKGQGALPRVSRLLDALASDNGMQLLQSSDRKQLSDFLKAIEQKAPNLHISFAIDPSSAFTAKIVTWLRANIHPYALMEIGLQPTIAAGCIVRTTNKVFDFSLRNSFADASGLLVKALEASAASTAPVTTVSTPVAVPVVAATAAPAPAPEAQA
jgi:F0F1-type ATP synthase delta subunit